MITTMALTPSALKNPFSSAMTNGRDVLPLRVVRPRVIRSWANVDWTDRTNGTHNRNRRFCRRGILIQAPPFRDDGWRLAGLQTVGVDARVPQNGITAQCRTEHVHLKLGGATWASVNMILTDVRLAGWQRRHHFAQVDHTVERVEFVVFIGAAKNMAAVRAANHFALAVVGDFHGRVELEQPPPAILCRRAHVAGFTGYRAAVSFAFVADLTAAGFRHGAVDSLSITGKNNAVNSLSDFAAHPAAAKIFQHRRRIAVDRIAETTAAGDVVDQQAAFGQRYSFRYPRRKERFTPFARAHRRCRRMIAGFYFGDHFQAGFDHHAGGADTGGEATGEAEAALGHAAVRLVVDAAIFRTVDEIDSKA